MDEPVLGKIVSLSNYSHLMQLTKKKTRLNWFCEQDSLIKRINS